MKTFLQRFLLFCFIIASGVIVVILVSNFIINSKINYTFSSKKNILILGDSQTQCALNDTVFNNAINLSESADTYFYSYLKLKKIIPHNTQIDTLFLAYAPHNVTKTQDNWLVDESINGFKLPLHFFLFESSDLFNFAKIAPLQLIKNYPKVVAKNASHLFRIYKKNPINKFGIGGYKALFHELGESNTEKPASILQKKQTQYATTDLNYLKKIYNYCTNKKIKIILIATPFNQEVVGVDKPYLNKYITFAKEEIPNATLFNYSNYLMEKKFFADDVHLNHEGAKVFTKMIKNTLKLKLHSKIKTYNNDF
ncbi:hypothetical protein [Flavobacterium sp.]|uniref:hypothetical protein n=1 Tax=Flavobacterium sp. TaxID=239 RepID=UPI003750DEDC